jgi:formate dehydrogenase subunit gamma
MMRGAIALLVVLIALASAPARASEIPANQPSNDTAALLTTLGQSQMPPRTDGFVHIQNQNAGVLIQPAGRMFRDVHSIGLFWINAAFIVVAVLAMAGLYLAIGSQHFTPDIRGRTILRFTGFERFVHWVMAFSFIVLGLTGLNMVLGRTLLQPILGDAVFSWITSHGKFAHNFLAFPFMAALFTMAVLWLRQNMPNRLDIAWFRAAGGMLGGPHPPARKFNAGQKMIYWAAVLGGASLSATGLALLVPFAFTDILGMQIIQVAHSLIAGGMIAIIIGHVYLGTIGVRGSFDAMATGRVDLNWARANHSLWVEEEVAQGRVSPDIPLPAE